MHAPSSSEFLDVVPIAKHVRYSAEFHNDTGDLSSAAWCSWMDLFCAHQMGDFARPKVKLIYIHTSQLTISKRKIIGETKRTMAAETVDDATSLQQAIARKRRLEARKRSHDSKHSVEVSSPEKVTSYQHLSLTHSTKRAAYQQRNTQVRYSPDVPMTEEELASWRRDQRRIRNRDSAATTRRKTRELISELQNAADQWKKKYEKLEAENANLLKKLQSPGVSDVSTDSMSKAIIPVPPSPELTSTANTPPIVTDENFVEDCCGEAMMKVQQQEPKQHLTEMISRPA